MPVVVKVQRRVLPVMVVPMFVVHDQHMRHLQTVGQDELPEHVRDLFADGRYFAHFWANWVEDSFSAVTGRWDLQDYSPRGEW